MVCPTSQVHYVISLAFLGDLKTTHVWKLCCMGSQKTDVSNFPDVYMSAILDFQNGRHKKCFFSKYVDI